MKVLFELSIHDSCKRNYLGKKSLLCGENVIYTDFEKQSDGNTNKDVLFVMTNIVFMQQQRVNIRGTLPHLRHVIFYHRVHQHKTFSGMFSLDPFLAPHHRHL